MKKYLVIACLITLLIACTESRKTQNSNLTKKTDSISSVVDTGNYNDITGFEDYYSKIPDIKLSNTMKKVALSTKSYEYSTEMSSVEYTQGLGCPEGKIVRDRFIVIIYSPAVSGYYLTIQTYTKNGDKISNQPLFGIEGMDDLNDNRVRYQDAQLLIDKELNIYNAYKDGYISNNGRDTVIEVFKSKYYRIDAIGKVMDVKK
jgi:hypothetical protein